MNEVNNPVAFAQNGFLNANQSEGLIELVSRFAGIGVMAATLAVVFAVLI